MKTIVYIGTSLDGFIARKDGDIDWLTQFADDEAIHAYEEFMNRIDAIVIGNYDFKFPNGQELNGSVAELWTAKNGKLQSLTIYFDTLTFANNTKS